MRRVALPSPGDDAELRELVGRLMSEPLDFARPLWQLYLVEGLDGGRHAYVNKTHHALVDGVAAIDVGTVILDPSPEGLELEITEERWEPDEPSPEMLFVRAASDRIRNPLRVARKAAREALVMPRSTATRVMRTAESFAKLAASGPAVSQDVPQRRDRPRPPRRLRERRPRRAQGRAPRRRDGQRRHPLGRRGGAAPRRSSAAASSLPPQIVALVPMSIRRPEEENELGNRIATLLVALPIGETDPVARLARSTPRPRG